MNYRVTFFKDRHKFSSAHFTIFSDGELECLHGHNYVVTVTLFGEGLKRGLLFPFHEVKPEIDSICQVWDEQVLLPTDSDWVQIHASGAQYEVKVDTPRHHKFYSLPKEDVVLLACDNVSCENLAALFADQLVSRLSGRALPLTALEISVSESAGQTVILNKPITNTGTER